MAREGVPQPPMEAKILTGDTRSPFRNTLTISFAFSETSNIVPPYR